MNIVEKVYDRRNITVSEDVDLKDKKGNIIEEDIIIAEYKGYIIKFKNIDDLWKYRIMSEDISGEANDKYSVFEKVKTIIDSIVKEELKKKRKMDVSMSNLYIKGYGEKKRRECRVEFFVDLDDWSFFNKCKNNNIKDFNLNIKCKDTGD